MQPKIILLSGKGQYAECIYNGLYDRFPVAHVIVEDQPDVAALLGAEKLGFVKTTGQQLFKKYIIEKLKKTSKARVKEIIQQNGLNFAKIPADKISSVTSVNDPSTIDLVQKANPDVVIVNSTRILGKTLLRAVPCPFINIHGGITPAYRGLAGSYWALANGEPHQCGSTIHLIDEGIDTGGILYQDTIAVSAADNYLTYSFLQIPKEIGMLKKALADIASNNLKPVPPSGPSRLWYEPTLWEYWYYYALRKVR